MEEEAMDYIHKIDDVGGMVKAIELGFPQKEITNSAYWYQKAVEKKDKIIVGVNVFEKEHEPISLLEIDESVAIQHLSRLREVKRTRNSAHVLQDLHDLKKAAEDEVNLMPFILKCVKSYATLGEIIGALKEVFGDYEEPIDF
jgi:methylmalonyl-CoA mutase N-terminal domain/subunit